MKKSVFHIALAMAFLSGGLSLSAQSTVDNPGRLIPVVKDGECGFIDKTGKLVIPCKYMYVGCYSDGMALVTRDVSLFGYIDTSGKEIIPCKYVDRGSNPSFHFGPQAFSEGLAFTIGTEDDPSNAFIDKTGRVTIPLEKLNSDIMYAEPFSEGLSAVARWNDDSDGGSDYIWGYIDKAGRLVIGMEYNTAGSFSEGMARVSKMGQYGFIDKTGKMVIPCKFSKAGNFSEGLARVRINGKYGFVDKSGKMVIPAQFDVAGDFQDGLACVMENDKYGFVDKSGKIVIPCQFDVAGDFREGLASVMKDDKYGFIDKSGKMVIPCKYDSVEPFEDGVSIVTLDGKYGLLDKDGKLVVFDKYDILGENFEALEMLYDI